MLTCEDDITSLVEEYSADVCLSKPRAVDDLGQQIWATSATVPFDFRRRPIECVLQGAEVL
jgi:hypothetical protein